LEGFGDSVLVIWKKTRFKRLKCVRLVHSGQHVVLIAVCFSTQNFVYIQLASTALVTD